MSVLDLHHEVVERIAIRLFGEPNRRLSRCGELRFGRRGSVAVIPARGVFADYEAGAAGGLLQMMVHAGAARTRREAARLLENDGVIPARETAAEARQGAAAARVQDERHRALAARLWRTASPLVGTLAETYLRQARAITAPPYGAGLRFLPAAPVYPYDDHCRTFAPAMIARVVNSAGDQIGAHLTHLSPAGSKADLAAPRKCIGHVGGGHVHLAPGKRVVVGEGVESALTAWQAVRRQRPDLGALAALSAGGMRRLAWPDEVVEVVVAPDRDAAGEEAAQALARRAYAAGLVVEFMRSPPPHEDWNDWARAELGRP
ncbi:MAG TPA: toprim domain-containing protein [Caulobacteraceae bacterium]|nr:toprim domain-containing protein [Caulobacteraceae bacterium]